MRYALVCLIQPHLPSLTTDTVVKALVSILRGREREKERERERDLASKELINIAKTVFLHIYC
jgi:hypothetical protein